MPSPCTDFYGVAPRSALKAGTNLSIVSTGVTMATDKTLKDHLVSFHRSKDCSTVRLEQGRTYCREDEPNPAPNVYCYRTLADVTCYRAPEPGRPAEEEVGTGF
ncbi:MAG: hypothetical protein HQL36_09670 [Alphaproteobacteria bacterium]|nr:hypothetical protein [Alphaproteobacteria bacterium]